MQHDFDLSVSGRISELSLKLGLTTFREVCDHLLHLTYRRPCGKTPESVLTEGCGTCSSKHGVLKAIADEQGHDQIELVLCLYRMSMRNTQGLDDIFTRGLLGVIPELHTYIRWGDEKLDVTKPGFHVVDVQGDVEKEQTISLEELAHKTEIHQKWMKVWLQVHRSDVSLKKAWQQREACIAALSSF